MKCPFCGEEMTLGYIQCRDGLNWTPKKQLVAALSVFGWGRIHLSNGADPGNRAVFAHNCKTCEKIIIDYKEEQV